MPQRDYHVRKKLKKMTRRVLADDCESEDSDEECDKTRYVKQVQNKIFFHADVSKKSILKLIECMAQATNYAMEHSDEPKVVLYIHSSGGDAYAGFSGLSHIENNRVPVICVADGFVASAATFLLLGGAQRFAIAYSGILIHQLKIGMWGKYSELLDEITNSGSMMCDITELYKQKTTMPPERLKELLSKEVVLGTSDAINYGFVSGIYTKANRGIQL